MGVNEGNSDFLVEKWEIYGLKRPKIKVSVGNKAVGGGRIGESSRGKMGGNGGNGEQWGKMGENGENGGKWGGNGEEMGGQMGEF